MIDNQTTIQRHPLNAFVDVWELDGDYIRCRECKRPQLVSHALHDFHHRVGCVNEMAERNPRRTLAGLITVQIAHAELPRR